MMLGICLGLYFMFWGLGLSLNLGLTGKTSSPPSQQWDREIAQPVFTWPPQLQGLVLVLRPLY